MLSILREPEISVYLFEQSLVHSPPHWQSLELHFFPTLQLFWWTKHKIKLPSTYHLSLRNYKPQPTWVFKGRFRRKYIVAEPTEDVVACAFLMSVRGSKFTYQIRTEFTILMMCWWFHFFTSTIKVYFIVVPNC